MKKIIALFMVVTLCASLAGCGKEKKVINENDIAQAMLSGLGEIAENVAVDRDGTLDRKIKKYEKAKVDVTDCLVSLSVADINIKSYAIFEDVDHEDSKRKKFLTIAADFTNKTDKEGCFVYDIIRPPLNTDGVCGIRAYQNGVSLNFANDFMNSEVIKKDLETKIRPGNTIEIMFSVWLRNEEEDVEIEFYDNHDYSASLETATCTIKLSLLSGRGEKAENIVDRNMKKYEKAKVDVTDCLASLSMADINIKSYAIFEDYDHKKLLTVAADFTNKTDKANRMCGIRAYQNGVSLDFASNLMNSEIIKKDLETPIKPGKTLEVMFSVWLRNEKEDVEIEFYDGRGNFDDRYYHDGRHYNNNGSPETTTCTIKLSK